jgi:hypothetical protein
MLIPEWLAEVAWERTHELPDRSFRWGRLGCDYVGDWHGVLVVRADATGAVKAWEANPAASADLVTKIREGEATAFLRALQGEMSFHASAVLLHERAVLLTGASGAGKSTLAAKLCTHFGAALLADDVAGLDLAHSSLRVRPSERNSWLARADGEKKPTPSRVAEASGELSLFLVLRFDDDLEGIRLRELRGAEVVPRILEGLLRFEPGPALWSREFDLFARLLRDVRLFEIARSRSVLADRTAATIVELAQTAHRIQKGEL